LTSTDLFGFIWRLTKPISSIFRFVAQVTAFTSHVISELLPLRLLHRSIRLLPPPKLSVNSPTAMPKQYLFLFFALPLLIIV